MEPLDFTRCGALNNIPKKKLLDSLGAIENSEDTLENKHVKLVAINRYAESNIPMDYWQLKMERDFKGDPRLKSKYEEYTKDLKASYLNGSSICFAGPHGVGKTLTTTCILKRACHKGYSCLYTVLNDVVNVLTSAPGEDKFNARREMAMVDFLVIDEVDNRFFGQSDSTNDLFARSFESIIRTRAQNKLPILMCTNSPNIVESFNGPLKASIGSLMKGHLEMFMVFGNDHRINK